MHTLPKFICKDARFKEHLNSLVSYVDIHNLPEHLQLPNYNLCIREAARIVRQRLLYDDADTPEGNRLLFASISRALWYNNARLALRILSHSRTARELLKVEGKQVSCIDHERFDYLFNQLHKQHIGKDIAGITHELAVDLSI
jgi:hypothetical protein